MRLPSKQRIIDRASGARADANQHHAYDTVRHLDKLISNLNRGMRMKFDESGALLVTSANTRGAIYRVTSTTCSCPAYVSYCTHRRLRDIIVAIQADDTSDPPPPEPNPLGDEEGDTPPGRPVAPRIIAARSLVWAAL